MKRIFGIILIMVLLSACSSQTVDSIQERGIVMAAMDYSMDKLMITADAYITKTEGFLSDSDQYYERDVMGFDGRMYTVKDLKGLTAEETVKLREDWIQAIEAIGLAQIDSLTDFWVSEVYEDPDLSFKYLYTRADINIMDKRAYYYRKYTFHKVDDQWKILVSARNIDYVEDPRSPEDLERFLQVGGEPIEFVQKISLNE